MKIRDILIIGIAVLLAGCSSDDITTGGGLEVSSISDEWDIKPGDPVAFTLLPSVKAQTRAKEKDDSFDSYADIENGYDLTIEMFGTGEVSKGSAVYSVTDGALVPKTTGSQLYWPDNTHQYGFKATAGTTTLEADQSDATNLRNQDRLEGYAFVPLKDGETKYYTEDVLNYKTSKQWKADNATFGKTEEELKEIPLYLKHMRAKITIILKAGTNVTSADLASASVTIYSYPGPIAVDKPLHTTVEGDPHYTAIVEPHDYKTNSTDAIARVSIPGKTCTFSVGNENEEEKKINYNLTAGQHLTITITLTTTN